MKKRINSRTKGQTAERKLVTVFEKWWGTEFFRTPGSGSLATMGFKKFNDISMSGDIQTSDPTFPFCVESKKVEGFRLEQILSSEKTLLHSWWEQTIRETPEDKKPLLVFTRNRAPLYAVLKADDLSQELYLNLHQARDSRVLDTCINGISVVIFLLDHLLATKKENWIYNK
jgi:hypothetical protein